MGEPSQQEPGDVKQRKFRRSKLVRASSSPPFITDTNRQSRTCLYDNARDGGANEVDKADESLGWGKGRAHAIAVRTEASYQ